jgi:hypothetical protein
MGRYSIAAVVLTVLILLPFQATCYGQEDCRDMNAQQVVPLPLRSADARRAAKKVAAFLGTEGKVVADEQTNTIFVRASPERIERVRKVLEQLDKPSYLYVVAVTKGAAARTAQSLQMLLAVLWLLGDNREALVVAEGDGDAILIRASEEKSREIFFWLLPFIDPGFSCRFCLG